jgi:hypothetical protein
MLKNNKEYLVLVPLIKKITKIESALNTLEGRGESIQAKVQSIQELNSTDFILRINKIIGIRNCALHGELKEDKITQALDECDIILRVIRQHMLIHAIRKKIELKLENLVKFKIFYKKSNIEVAEAIELEEKNSIEYLDNILKNDKDRLLILEKDIKAYWIDKIVIPLVKGVAILIVAYYFWSKVYR